jgi:hypothetical protein
MEPLVLLQRVHEVSLCVDPSAPTRVSQRAFDAARAGGRFPDLPAAHNIARSLRISWAETLSLAHADEGERAWRLALKQRVAAQDWLDEGYIAFALSVVALRRETRSLSISQYRIERERMLAADHARWLHGRRLFLPNDEQVTTRAGSWPAALRLAGLEEADQWEGSRAPSLVDLMGRFHEHHGTRPAPADLEAFARGNGIPYPERRRQRFRDALAEWTAKRAQEGLPAPYPPPPVRERPDYSRDVGARRPGERRRPKGRDQEGCVAWMQRYLEDLPDGARSSQRSYRDWSTGLEGAPSAGTIGRYGGFTRVRALAQERMRAEGRG